MKINLFAIITLAVSALIVVAIAFFAISPLLSQIQSAKDETAAKQNTLSDLKSRLHSLTELEKNVDSLPPLQNSASTLDDYVATAEKIVPKEPLSGDFLIKLEAFMGQSGIASPTFDVPGIATQAAASGSSGSTTAAKTGSVLSGAQAATFNIGGQANYDKLKSFLDTVKTIQRLNEVSSLSITTGTTGQTGDNLTVQLTGNYFSAAAPTTGLKIDVTKLFNDASQAFRTFVSYGQSINIPVESGFGRPNPFMKY